MAAFVLDASVALAWCFDDERNSWADELLDRLGRGDRLVVPAHWQSEILNGFLIAARRKRIRADQPSALYQAFARLPIETSQPLSPSQAIRVLNLGQKYQLTAYDAAYLELAQRLNLPLGTLDADLRRAAEAEGAALL